MVRAERKDTPGSWHHVVNRGVAQRSVFEDRADCRFFLSRLARVGRLGILEVHAYCLLGNHFHLLVRSPAGELAQAMRLAQNAHARFFNRRRGRDGPLFRGRFLSRLIESETYWWTVLRYIDFNACLAGLVLRPQDYPYGSAWHYVRPGPHPRWLVRSQVERAAMGDMGRQYDPGRYRALLARELTTHEFEIVERTLGSAHAGTPPLDDLLLATSASIKEWLRVRARVADGTTAGPILVTAETTLRLLRTRESLTGQWLVGSPRAAVSAWVLLACGLLRTVCGLSLRETASRLECSEPGAYRRIQAHERLILSDERYAEVSAGVLSDALRLDFGPAVAARSGGG